MTDPATHLPRHVRVVDYAAARATEVRPPAAADESLASLIHPHRVAFLLSPPLPMRTTQRTQPNRDLTRWRQAYSRGDTRTLRPEARARGETPDPTRSESRASARARFPIVVSPRSPNLPVRRLTPFLHPSARRWLSSRTHFERARAATSAPRVSLATSDAARRAIARTSSPSDAVPTRSDAGRSRRGASTHPPTAPPRTPSRSPSRRNTCACIGAARRDDVLSARDAPSRPPLERVGWRRTSGTRNGSRCVVVGASSRRSVDPVAAAVGARSIATREPPRWRTTRRTTPRSRWWVLARPWTRRFATSSAAAWRRIGVVSRVRARRDGARRRHSRRRGRPRRARHVPPIRHGRRRGDGVDARGGGGDGGSDPRRRRERRGVATRRVNSATTRVEVCGATARDVVDAILGGGRALDDVDGVFGETCEVPRGVASRARTAGDPRDAARRVSEKTEYSMETVHSDVIAGTGASTTDSDVIAIAAKTPEKASAPATPSEYAAYRASRRARAFRLHHRDGREAYPTRRRREGARRGEGGVEIEPVDAGVLSSDYRSARQGRVRARARGAPGVYAHRARGVVPSVVVGADSSRRASGGEEGVGLARATSGRGDVPGGFSGSSRRRGRVGAKRLRRRRANANARRRAEGETRGDWRERDDRFRDASTRRERRRPSIERRVGGGDGVEDDARAGGKTTTKMVPRGESRRRRG